MPIGPGLLGAAVSGIASRKKKKTPTKMRKAGAESARNPRGLMAGLGGTMGAAMGARRRRSATTLTNPAGRRVTSRRAPRAAGAFASKLKVPRRSRSIPKY